MFQSLDIFRTSMAMARHAGQMQAHSAQNIANADTPGYRATDMAAFHTLVQMDGRAQRSTRAGHIHTPWAEATRPRTDREQADPNGNTVSLETEMVKAVDAKRQHDRALSIYRSGLSILRASINTR